MGNFDTSWISMKRFLGNTSVKDDIINFDSRRITPEIREAVQDLLNKRGNSFEHAVIHRVSVAASPLAAWVKANLEYSAVLIRIQPLQDENDRLQAELLDSKDRLDKCQLALGHLDNKVKELKNEFAKKTAEAKTTKKAEGPPLWERVDKCTACHVETSWTKVTEPDDGDFDHALTGFPLKDSTAT